LTPEDESLRLAHRERALHMWLNLVGHKVVLTLTDATVVEGILHTATPLVMAKVEERNQYVLKAVRVVQQPTTGTAPAGSTWLVAMDRVVQMHVKSLAKTATNGRAAFTDTEISGATAGSSAKDLQEAGSAWTTAPKAGGAALNSRAEALGGGTPAAVETKVGLAGSIGQWDQFKANETLFNVKGSYDENLYTTELDKTALSAAAKAKAARLAKEIEGTASTNWHVAEERGQKVQGDFDEEDLYSGVLKTSAVKAAAAPGMSYAKVAKSSAEEKQEALETAVAAVKIEADAKVEDTPVVTPPPVKTVAKVETKKEEKKDAQKSTKLNANAKSFSLNFNAKSFTPTFESAPAAEVPPVPLVDPNTGMHLAHVPPGGAAYMQQPQQGKLVWKMPFFLRAAFSPRLETY
jgi:PAB1-binding protein PBP1